MSWDDREPVHCDVDEVDLETEDGREIPGVRVTCTECQHETESFGQHDGSVRRCLALMREECPFGESNYYTGEL